MTTLCLECVGPSKEGLSDVKLPAKVPCFNQGARSEASTSGACASNPAAPFPVPRNISKHSNLYQSRCATLKLHSGFVRPYSPTAESFGVSADRSGVVQGSTRVPQGFHKSSTRVTQEFYKGSTRVRLHKGSTRVTPGFHQVPRGLWGGASTTNKSTACWGYHQSLFSGLNCRI